MGSPSLWTGFMRRVNRVIIRSVSSFSKVPQLPTTITVDNDKLPKSTPVDCNLVEKLERLALVDFDNEDAIERLKDSIRSAQLIFTVDTTNIKPLVSLLEDRSLYLREDKVAAINGREEILQNASVTLEDYFVAPPGNIPLKKKTAWCGHLNPKPLFSWLQFQGSDIVCIIYCCLHHCCCCHTVLAIVLSGFIRYLLLQVTFREFKME